jgi:hypothetical protein
MAKKTIKLLGECIQNEDEKAIEAITPGHLIVYNGTTGWIKHATAAGPVIPVQIALEREEMGKDIDQAYAINDTVKACVPYSGCRFNGLVAAAAPAIVKGDLLESAGNGTVRKVTTGADLDIVGVALESVDNSAGGTAVRIRVACR